MRYIILCRALHPVSSRSEVCSPGAIILTAIKVNGHCGMVLVRLRRNHGMAECPNGNQDKWPSRMYLSQSQYHVQYLQGLHCSGKLSQILNPPPRLLLRKHDRTNANFLCKRLLLGTRWPECAAKRREKSKCANHEMATWTSNSARFAVLLPLLENIRRDRWDRRALLLLLLQTRPLCLISAEALSLRSLPLVAQLGPVVLLTCRRLHVSLSTSWLRKL